MLYYDGRAPHGRALRNIDGGLGKSFRTVDDELRRVDSFRIIYFRAESFPRADSAEEFPPWHTLKSVECA